MLGSLLTAAGSSVTPRLWGAAAPVFPQVAGLLRSHYTCVMLAGAMGGRAGLSTYSVSALC